MTTGIMIPKGSASIGCWTASKCKVNSTDGRPPALASVPARGVRA